MKVKFRDHGEYLEKIALTIVMLAFLLNPVSGAVIDISNSSALPDASSYTLINLSGMNNFGAVAIDLYYNGSVVSVTSASLGFSGHGVSLTSNINNTIGKARFLITTTDMPGPNSPLTLLNLSLKAVGKDGQISTLGLSVPTLADTDGSSPSDLVVNNGIFIILPSATPPASITNLINTSYAPDHINWTWKDPEDLDFSRVKVYFNGVFQKDIVKGVQYYNATGLAQGTIYTISTRSVDTFGNINATWMNHTAMTSIQKDTTPPTWSPVPGNQVVELGSNFRYDVNAVDLQTITYSVNDTVRFTIHPITGLITNSTILDKGSYGLIITAKDASENSNSATIRVTVQDTTPPGSVQNLVNSSYAQTYINWTWNDPNDTDFIKVMVYIDGVLKSNITKGAQFYNASGLNPGTTHTIGTRTADLSGNINATWVNYTSKTSPSIGAKGQNHGKNRKPR